MSGAGQDFFGSACLVEFVDKTMHTLPMTQTSKKLLLALTALIIGILMGAGVARVADELTGPKTLATHGEAVQTPAPVAPVAVQAPAEKDQLSSALGTDYGIVRVALGDADYTQAEVTQVLTTADQVCEGQQAGVPITTLEQTVAAHSGLDMPTAHDFVALVLLVRC